MSKTETSKKSKPLGLDAAWVGALLKYAGRGHVALYQATGGKIGGNFRVGSALWQPVPVLLLDHVGRKSGEKYLTPLLFMQDGADYVIVASQGGRAKDPQWYRNLMASPDTTIQIGNLVYEVTARTADEKERQRLWPRLVDLYADFAAYQSWTDREIPVVILAPRKPRASRTRRT